MAASVMIALSDGNARAGLPVPARSVFYDAEGKPCVWRIDPDRMTVVKQVVDTGAVDGNRIFLTEGMDPGMRIVTAGARFLREGQKIRLLQTAGQEG